MIFETTRDGALKKLDNFIEALVWTFQTFRHGPNPNINILNHNVTSILGSTSFAKINITNLFLQELPLLLSDQNKREVNLPLFSDVLKRCGIGAAR